MPEGDQQLQFPKGAAASGAPEPLIFVMPERYRGGHTPMVEPKPSSPPKPSKPSTPPPPPKPPPLPTGKPLPAKKKSNAKVLVIAGALVLVALGLAGFFLLQTLEAPEAEPEPQAVLPPPPLGSTAGETEGAGETGKPPETTDPFASPARPGVDSDSDGLTDVEEQILYATDPFLPDTDTDGFLDGNEVFHGYNPKGTAPSTLETAGLVKPYNASVAMGEDAPPYAILYPAAWEVGGDTVNVGFISTTGERITLAVTPKEPAPERTGFRQSMTKNGLPLFQSEDQLIAYVEGEKWIVKFTYDRGVKGSVDYLQTFQMMLNSLSF